MRSVPQSRMARELVMPVWTSLLARGAMAHKEIDSRHRVLGYGIDPSEIDRAGVPAILNAVGNCQYLVVDEVGKFTVESEGFVSAVKGGAEV